MSNKKDLQICSYDVVFNRTHKVSSIYKYFQQIAGENLDELGLTYDALLEKNLVFVLAKMKSVFYRPITKNEKLTLETVHRRVKGASFIRDYTLTSKGELIAEASSYWALIDVNTRRLCRPSVLEDSFTEVCELCSFEIEGRFSFPDDLNKSYYGYKVVFTDIDENSHMNNTRYPDICLDAIGGIKEDEYVSAVRLDYLTEAKLGEELQLVYAYSEKENTYYFSAMNVTTGSRCFDAEIVISKK